MLIAYKNVYLLLKITLRQDNNVTHFLVADKVESWGKSVFAENKMH